MKPIEAQNQVIAHNASAGMPRSGASRLLQALAGPYQIATSCRNALYDRGWLPQRRLPCRVVSIGNLTVGGTGKTPVTIFVTNALVEAGYRVGVLSRGYRRQSQASRLLVSDGHEILVGPDASGDEPFLIAQRCPNAIVAVGADRYRLGRWVLEHSALDCLVLDDGFQHRALARDVDLLLVDATDQAGLRALVPSGRLREPLTSAVRASAWVITRVQSHGEAESFLALLRAASGCKKESILLRFVLQGFIDIYSGAPVSPDETAARRVVILSGIGNPEAFRRLVMSQPGLSVADAVVFPDHHAYTDADMVLVKERADRAGASALVTTEKDAVKLRRLAPLAVPVWAGRLETDIFEGRDRLERLILGKPVST